MLVCYWKRNREMGKEVKTMSSWQEFLESALDQFQKTVPAKSFVILDGRIVPIELTEVPK